MGGGPWSDFYNDLVGGNSEGNSDDSPESDGGSRTHKYDTGDRLSAPEDSTIPDGLTPSSLEGINTIYFGDLGKEKRYVVKSKGGRRILIVDPENFDRQEWLALDGAFDKGFHNSDGFSIESASEIAAIAKDKSKRESVDDFCEFYEDKVPSRFYKMIRESMFLRLSVEQEGLAFDEVRARKRQIAKHTKRDEEAFAISSLCSAGYLDEGKFFREMYRDMVMEGPSTVEDYCEAFVQIVVDRAFVTFVKGEDAAKEVYHEVFGKSMHVDKYPYRIEFIDICGKGEFNRGTIDDVVEYFEEHHADIQIKKIEDEDQLTYRIDPTTL